MAGAMPEHQQVLSGKASNSPPSQPSEHPAFSGASTSAGANKESKTVQRSPGADSLDSGQSAVGKGKGTRKRKVPERSGSAASAFMPAQGSPRVQTRTQAAAAKAEDAPLRSESKS